MFHFDEIYDEIPKSPCVFFQKEVVMDIRVVMQKILVAAELAAGKKMDQLIENGPKYTVHCSNGFDVPREKIGTLLDLCGGGWIKLKKCQKLVNQIKKLTDNKGNFVKGWLVKSHDSGYNLSLNYPSRRRQEISVHKAAYEAALEELKKYADVGNSYVHTYID